jgi:hypothetical protein
MSAFLLTTWSRNPGSWCVNPARHAQGNLATFTCAAPPARRVASTGREAARLARLAKQSVRDGRQGESAPRPAPPIPRCLAETPRDTYSAAEGEHGDQQATGDSDGRHTSVLRARSWSSDANGRGGETPHRHHGRPRPAKRHHVGTPRRMRAAPVASGRGGRPRALQPLRGALPRLAPQWADRVPLRFDLRGEEAGTDRLLLAPCADPGPALRTAETTGSVVIMETDGTVHAIISIPSDDRPIVVD